MEPMVAALWAWSAMLVSIFQNPELNSTKWGRRRTRRGHATVAGVNGAVEDEVDVEESKEGTTPIPCTIHSCNGLTNEHAPHKHPSVSLASAL